MGFNKIHFIGPKDKNQWSPIWGKCFSFWQNSQYSIELWDDERIDIFIKEDDLNFFYIIDQLPRIYKYDFVRYLILKNMGGAYFDLDVEIITDFLPLLSQKKVYLLGGGRLDCYVSNAIMISPPFHPLWGDIIKRIKYDISTNLFDLLSQPLEAVLFTTGPDALSKYIALGKYNINLLSYHHFGDKESGLSFSIHHLTNNWHKF